MFKLFQRRKQVDFDRPTKRTRKHLYKIFPDVPRETIDMTYDLFYFGGMGFLACYNDQVMFDKLLLAYGTFMKECEDIVETKRT